VLLQAALNGDRTRRDHPAVPLSAELARDAAACVAAGAGAMHLHPRDDAGVGIEAGVWSVQDAERLASFGLGDRLTRILVEPVDVPGADAVATVEAIHEALDRLGLTAPRLQHGDGEATWILIADAFRRGIDTRVGLEDTLDGPDNAALVRAAREAYVEPRRMRPS
jgi:uncharacterized protein (DUF849 family)